MTKMFRLLNQFHNDESGQGLVEYLLILALVALGAIAGMQNVASYMIASFNKVGSKVGSFIS
jgi:Flp pilus assembly pilin Flp